VACDIAVFHSRQEAIMPSRITPSIFAVAAAVILAASGISAIGPALAQPPSEQAGWVGLVNRCEPALSETEFALAEHRPLRRTSFDGSRD
jgi:hypothetical protein